MAKLAVRRTVLARCEFVEAPEENCRQETDVVNAICRGLNSKRRDRNSL